MLGSSLRPATIDVLKRVFVFALLAVTFISGARKVLHDDQARYLQFCNTGL